MDVMKFVSDNMVLIALAAVSGGMLVWPMLRGGSGGSSVDTLGATLLMNQQNALVLDVREEAEFAAGHIVNARNVPLGRLSGSSDVAVLAAVSEIMAGVTASSGDVAKHKDKFARYRELWESDKAQYMKRFRKANPPLAVFEQTIDKFVGMEAEVRSDIDPSENIFFLKVDHLRLKDELTEHCRLWKRALTKLLADNAGRELRELHERLAESARCLSAAPTNLEVPEYKFLDEKTLLVG